MPRTGGSGGVTGTRSGNPIQVTVTQDGTKERLDVSATVDGVAEANLDLNDDEVTVGGAEDGSGTRRLMNVDSAGRLRTDSTLQIADADVSTTNPVPVQGRAADGAAVAGNPVLVAGQDGTNAQSLRTDTTGNQGAYAKTSVLSAADGASNNLNQPTNEGGGGITPVIAPLVFNGSTWDRLRGSTNGVRTQGSVAHDAVDAGDPVKVGAKAIAHGSNPTAVAAADRTDLYANRAGVPFVIGGHPNIITRRDNFTTAQTDTALVTVAGGSKIVVTRVTVTMDEANTVGVGFRVGFGAANTPTGAGVVASHPGVVGGGGITIGDGSGILGVGADGEDLRLTCDVPTGGSIDVNVSYHTIES